MIRQDNTNTYGRLRMSLNEYSKFTISHSPGCYRGTMALCFHTAHDPEAAHMHVRLPIVR